MITMTMPALPNSIRSGIVSLRNGRFPPPIHPQPSPSERQYSPFSQSRFSSPTHPTMLEAGKVLWKRQLTLTRTSPEGRKHLSLAFLSETCFESLTNWQVASGELNNVESREVCRAGGHHRRAGRMVRIRENQSHQPQPLFHP